MKRKYFKLLGAKVLPIVRRSQWGAAECDSAGQLPYLSGNEAIAYAKAVVDRRVKEQREDNKGQDWEVFSIHADGTFTLKSDMGYEQINVSRSDFRLIKN